jgi:putative zinc finger protein
LFSQHIAHVDLVLAADAELTPRRLRAVQQHLAVCKKCRNRMALLGSTSADLQAAYRERLDPSLSRLGPARLALLAALGAESNATHPRRWNPFSVMSLRWAYTLAVLVIIGLGVAAAYSRLWLARPGGSIAQVEAAPLPKPLLTPGAALTMASDICFVEHKEDAAAIPVAKRKEVFREYGIDYRHAANYELDHLITPALGGTDDIHNLWPEPYSDTLWNAHVKDQIEDALHDMVCSGQMDLPTAQREIATDWIAAYKKHFHTNAPLAHPPDTDGEPTGGHDG